MFRICLILKAICLQFVKILQHLWVQWSANLYHYGYATTTKTVNSSPVKPLKIFKLFIFWQTYRESHIFVYFKTEIYKLRTKKIM